MPPATAAIESRLEDDAIRLVQNELQRLDVEAIAARNDATRQLRLLTDSFSSGQLQQVEDALQRLNTNRNIDTMRSLAHGQSASLPRRALAMANQALSDMRRWADNRPSAEAERQAAFHQKQGQLEEQRRAVLGRLATSPRYQAAVRRIQDELNIRLAAMSARRDRLTVRLDQLEEIRRRRPVAPRKTSGIDSLRRRLAELRPDSAAMPVPATGDELEQVVDAVLLVLRQPEQPQAPAPAPQITEVRGSGDKERAGATVTRPPRGGGWLYAELAADA